MVLFLVLFFLLIIFDQACGDCVAWFILGITWFHKIKKKKKKKNQTRLILTLFQHQIFFFFFLILTPKKKKIVNKTKQNNGVYT